MRGDGPLGVRGHLMYRARGNTKGYQSKYAASGQNCSSPPTNRRYRTLIGAAPVRDTAPTESPHAPASPRSLPGGSFGETMNAVRIWLDHHEIRPTSFLPITQIDSGVGFQIGFNREHDALLFEREFA